MIEFLVGILVTLAFYGLAIAGRRLYRYFRRSRAHQYDPCWCGKKLSRRTVHRIIEVQDDDDLVESDDKGNVRFKADRGEGSAMVAELCAEHCTGGCNRECSPREVKFPSRKLGKDVSVHP